MQEEIIASYEAAYGEAPGLVEEQHEEEQPNESFLNILRSVLIIDSIMNKSSNHL